MREALATRYAAGVATRREKTEYGYSTTGYRVSSTSYVDERGSTGFTLAHRVEFLADEHSLTGYAQTLRESHFAADGSLASAIDYSYGQDELTQTTRAFDAEGVITSEETLTFGHDAHGSVRLLTTLAGPVEQLFIYDAYGADLATFNAVASAFSTSTQPRTNVRYNGEYFDNPSQQYYFRARLYDAQAGRFTTLDPYSGDIYNPLSFHKYGFTHGDPVQGFDPSGEIAAATTASSVSIAVSARIGHDVRVVHTGDYVKGTFETAVTFGENLALRGMQKLLAGEFEEGIFLLMAGKYISGASQIGAGVTGLYIYSGGASPRPSRWSYRKAWHDKRVREIFGKNNGRRVDDKVIGRRIYDADYKGRDIEFKSANFERGPRSKEELDTMLQQARKDADLKSVGGANPHWHFDHNPTTAPKMAPVLKQLREGNIPYTWGQQAPF